MKTFLLLYNLIPIALAVFLHATSGIGLYVLAGAWILQATLVLIASVLVVETRVEVGEIGEEQNH